MIRKFTLMLFFAGMMNLLSAQVIINEILTNGQIELKNVGTTMVDVTSYWLCDWPAYGQVGGQTLICGNLNMAPNDIVVISGFLSDYVDSELGLYSSSAFSAPTAMVDYVEWGSSGHQRSTVAVAAGIWSTGDFVPGFSASASIEFDGSGDSSTDWVAQMTNTSCAENAAASGGCTVDGGMISTNDPTTICAGDGTPDNINVSLANNVGTNSAWVVTDTNNEILALPTALPINFDDAGPGTCLIWHLSYEPGLMGLAEGNDAGTDLVGCFALSNAITVVRNEPDGGTISTNDPTTICALDGVPDPINVSLTDNVGANGMWVISTLTGDIIGLETAPPFDLSGAGAGTCVIGHISYENGLTGLSLGGNINSLTGCFSFSNAISVERIVATGTSVSIAGGGNAIEVCVGDGEADVVAFATSNADLDYQYIITDENNMILDIPAGSNFDFEGAVTGVCRVWGVAYTGNFMGNVGDNAAMVALSSECFGLSTNFIEVNRVDAGANCAVATFDIEGEVYQMNLSPNPAMDRLQILINGQDLDQGQSVLSVLNLEGKVVSTKQYQLMNGEQLLSLDVAALPKGIYLLQLRNNGKVFHDKFVKQ